MPREKNKFTYNELEEHTIFWATDRLEEVREIVDKIYLDLSMLDEQKEFIYSGMAHQVSDLLELIIPLRHDEEYLLLWAQDFVDEYQTFDKNSFEG